MTCPSPTPRGPGLRVGRREEKEKRSSSRKVHWRCLSVRRTRDVRVSRNKRPGLSTTRGRFAGYGVRRGSSQNHRSPSVPHPTKGTLGRRAREAGGGTGPALRARSVVSLRPVPSTTPTRAPFPPVSPSSSLDVRVSHPQASHVALPCLRPLNPEGYHLPTPPGTGTGPSPVLVDTRVDTSPRGSEVRFPGRGETVHPDTLRNRNQHRGPNTETIFRAT